MIALFLEMDTASMESHDQQLQSDFTLSAPATKKTHTNPHGSTTNKNTRTQVVIRSFIISLIHPPGHASMQPSVCLSRNGLIHVSTCYLSLLQQARSSLSRSDCEALSSWCTHQMSLVFPLWRLFCFVAGTRTGLGSQQKLVGPNIRGHPVSPSCNVHGGRLRYARVRKVTWREMSNMPKIPHVTEN